MKTAIIIIIIITHISAYFNCLTFWSLMTYIYVVLQR